MKRHHVMAASAAVAVLCIGLLAGCGTDPEMASTAAPGPAGIKGNHLAGCVPMFGSTFCSIGLTTVSSAGGGTTVAVSDFGDVGTNGFSSSFTSTSSWEQNANTSGRLGGSAWLRYTAVSSGTPQGWLQIEQQGANNVYDVKPYFHNGVGATSFTASVYNNGILQTIEAGIPDATAIVFNGNPWVLSSWWLKYYYGLDKWDLLWGGGVIRLPSGTEVWGNRLTLETASLDPARAATSHQGMNITGNVDDYEVLNELTP